MYRRAISFAISALVVTIAILAAPRNLVAQCMKCASSHSCTTSDERGGCDAQCDSTGKCTCTDDLCEVEPEGFAVTTVTEGGVKYAFETRRNGHLLSDCHGQVFAIIYGSEERHRVERQLARISLVPVRPVGQWLTSEGLLISARPAGGP